MRGHKMFKLDKLVEAKKMAQYFLRDEEILEVDEYRYLRVVAKGFIF